MSESQFTVFRMILFTYSHSLFDMLSLLLNTVLILLVIFKTAPSFRSYSLIILCVTLADVVIGVSCGFGMIRIVPIGNSLTFIFHGQCRKFGEMFCIAAHSATVHAVAYSVTLIPLSFWYRNRVVSKPPPSPVFVIVVCLLIYAPAFLSMIIFASARDSPAVIREVWRTANWTIIPDDPQLILIGGFRNIYERGAIVLILWVCLPIFPCYAISIYYRYNIVKALKYAAMSPKAKDMQTKIVKALTIQAAIPIVMLSQSCIYLWRQFSLPFHELMPYYEESVFLFLAIVSALNPVITIYYVLPYRHATVRFLKFWRRGPSRISSVAVSTNNNGHSNQENKSTRRSIILV